MSEILCPLCNAQSPENAFYCQQCGQPIKCKECETELLPNAHACIRCGKLIPERSTNGQFQIGSNTVPPGYNRLKLHETPDVRDIDLIVHNDAIEHLRDFFPPLVGNRPSGRPNSSVNQQVQEQTDVVEVPSALPAPQPQLAPTSSQSSIPQEGIWQIFRNRDKRLTQERRDLKATSKRDYIIRLAYLYMFARYRIGDEKVTREDVFKILDEAGVKDAHRSTYINESSIRTDENDDLWLDLDGRERAEQYIADVLDPTVPEGWLKGAESYPTSNRPKKPAKKGSEQHSSSNTEIAQWISHETTKELARTIPHSIIDTMTVQNMALFALYCLDKTGVTSEVQISQISQYLFQAFQIQVDRHSLPNPLARAANSKPALATYRKGSGYRITSSGIDYIDKLLKNKQAEYVSATTAEAIGAAVI
jgi:Double zinc ribbon